MAAKLLPSNQFIHMPKKKILTNTTIKKVTDKGIFKNDNTVQILLSKIN